MSTLFESLLRPNALRARYQPIVDIRRPLPETVAVEGLTSGPISSNLERPDLLFEYARRKRREDELDRAAVATLLRHAEGLPTRLGLHLNVHASTLGRDRFFAQFLRVESRKAGIATDRLTLEIVEHAESADENPMQENLAELRSAGVRIALDDVGRGTSNFRTLLLIRPKLLKADTSLVRGLAEDGYKQATLRSVRLLADQLGARLVAEGIERDSDLAAARDLAVDLAQGFLFARPIAAEDLLSHELVRPGTEHVAAGRLS